MPGTLCASLYVSYPENLISSLFELTSHVSHGFLKIFQCRLHIWWPVSHFIGPCRKDVSLFEILQHSLPAPLDFVLSIDRPHLFLCRFGSLCPPCSRTSIPAIMELLYINDISLSEPVSLSLNHSLCVLSLISLSSPNGVSSCPVFLDFFGPQWYYDSRLFTFIVNRLASPKRQLFYCSNYCLHGYSELFRYLFGIFPAFFQTSGSADHISNLSGWKCHRSAPSDNLHRILSHYMSTH